MNKTLIVAADLGHFKAYRVTTDPLGNDSPRITLIKSFDNISAKKKAADTYSDNQGKFGVGGSTASSTGTAERHSLGHEKRRKLVENTAKSICSLLKEEGLPHWHLAACREMNNCLTDKLNSKALGLLGTNLKRDLTKAHKTELLSRFMPQ